MGTTDPNGIDGIDWGEAASVAAQTLRDYQAEEVELLKAYTKQKQAQQDLINAKEEKRALKRKQEVGELTEAEKERYAELEKLERKFQARRRAAEKQIKTLRDQNENLYAKQRASRLESYARRQLTLNQKIADQELAIEDKITEEELSNDERIFNIRSTMIAETKTLEELGLKDIDHRNRDYWTSLNKLKIQDSKKFQLIEQTRDQNLHNAKVKNITARADWEINKQKIIDTNAEQRHEQRVNKLLELETNLATSRADRESFIEDTIEQRQREGAQRISDLETQLLLERKDLANEVDRQIEEARLAGLKKVIAAEKEAAKYRGGKKGTQKQKDAKVKKMVEADSKARHAESVARVAKNEYELKLFNFDEEQQILDTLAENASVYDKDIAKQRRALKVGEREHATRVLREIEKAELAADKQIQDAKVKADQYNTMTAEQRIAYIAKTNEAVNTTAEGEIAKKQLDLDARRENTLQAAATRRKNEALTAATDIQTKEEELIALKTDKEQRYADNLAKIKLDHSIAQEKLDQSIEQEKLNRAILSLQLLEKLAKESNDRIEKAKTKQDTYKKYSEEDMAGASEADRKLMEEHNAALEKAQAAKAALINDEKRSNILEGLRNTEAEIAAIRAASEDPSALHLQVLSDIANSEKSALSAIDAAKAKKAKFNGGDATMSDTEKAKNRSDMMFNQWKQMESDLEANLSEKSFNTDFKEIYVDLLNANKNLEEQEETRGKIVDLANEERYYNIYSEEIAKRTLNTLIQTAKTEKSHADVQRKTFEAFTQEQIDAASDKEKRIMEAHNLVLKTAQQENALSQIGQQRGALSKSISAAEEKLLANKMYSAEEIANAADAETKARMKAHNVELEALNADEVRAELTVKRADTVEAIRKAENHIKALRETSQEDIDKMAVQEQNNATEATINKLNQGKAKEQAYKQYSQEEIDLADDAKKAEMLAQNAKVEKLKQDQIEAHMSATRGNLAEEIVNAEAEVAAMRAEENDEELKLLKEKKKSIDKEKELLNLRKTQKDKMGNFSDDMYMAVQKKEIEDDPKNKYADSYKEMLMSGDTAASQQYLAEVADKQAYARSAAVDGDGNFVQEIYDQILEAEMKKIDAKYDYESDAYAQYIAAREYDDRMAKKAEKKEKVASQFKEAFNPMTWASALGGDEGAKAKLSELKNNLLPETTDGKGRKVKDLGPILMGLSSVLENLEGKMKEVGKYQAPIDTRLNGTMKTFMGTTGIFTAMAAASPTILQSDLMDSMLNLVEQGIAHNVQLRAYLDVASKKIATTFEVADSTLLKLVRIQQADTTLARLGMESALNEFLNNMYETTEYLSSLADSVRQNLYEAQALMGAKEATEFEYQVQKWMGSMHSVGMSDEAVSSISTALGQLAAGQIDALTNGGVGNLLVMAANKVEDLSLGDILKDGLNASQTNKLLEASVEYLAEIANRSDSKVVQQELAKVFGVTASDLKAIGNIADERTLKNIKADELGFGEMVGEAILRDLTAITRTHMSEMMTNVWENLQWTMAAGIASNPVTYLMFKMSNLLEEATGGIDLPFLNVYGFGVDLNTSLAQLMQVGAMAGGILTSIGMGIAGLAGGGNILNSLGASAGLETVSRGDGRKGGAAGGSSTSESGSLVANGSGGDVQAATMASAAADMAKQSIQGKEDNEDATRDDIIEFLMKQFQILFGKFDLSISALKLQGLTIGDKINGTDEAQNVLMGGWSNGSVASMSGTTKNRM